MEKEYRVLIADDNELMRNSLVQACTNHQFKALEAGDGEKALMTALTLHPDVVVLDVEMPKLNGMQVIEKIREDEWGKNVPIIFLTSFDTSDKMVETIAKYNPSFYLRKDETNPEELIKRIKDTLKI